MSLLFHPENRYILDSQPPARELVVAPQLSRLWSLVIVSQIQLFVASNCLRLWPLVVVSDFGGNMSFPFNKEWGSWRQSAKSTKFSKVWG